MLQIRVEGDPVESRALLERLRGAGVEVQVGTVKRRAEGFCHTYAVARIADYEPAGEATTAAADAAAAGPVRVPSTVGRALPAGERRPARARRTW